MNKVFGKKKSYAPIKEDASRVIISYGMDSVDKNNATWIEIYLAKKQINHLSLDDVKAAIIADINAQTDEKILSGFVWNGTTVWLSAENQRNFSEAQRLGIVPVTFKLGEQEDGTPVYHTFDTTAELDGFYHQAAAYIQQCLQTGWYVKDNIDWTPYEAMFAEK